MRADRVRDKMLKDIAMVMLEAGRPLTEYEYKKTLGIPYRIPVVQKYFGRWVKVVNYIQTELPDVWEQITNPQKPAEPQPKPQVKVAKPQVKAAPKPKAKAKPAVKKD